MMDEQTWIHGGSDGRIIVERLGQKVCFDGNDPMTAAVQIGTLLEEIERLKSALQDVQDATDAAMDERCDANERHCTCVPLLRSEIERLQAANAAYHAQLTGTGFTTYVDRMKEQQEKIKRLRAENEKLRDSVSGLRLKLFAVTVDYEEKD